MARFVNTFVAPAAAMRVLRLSPWSVLSATFAALVAVWIAQRRWRQEMSELQSYTDRDLHDLGISRGNIRGVCEGRYRRDG